MKIVIVGVGKIGYAVADQLSREGHDIAVIDSKPERLGVASNTLDIIAVEGSGAGVDVLREAGIDGADLLIATTGSDELNLVCCMIGKQLGAKHTIARVRNPEYTRQAAFLKESFGLSMLINPEQEAASEISRILRFPSATRVDTFANDGMELVEYRLPQNSSLDGLPLNRLGREFHAKVLICALERGSAVHIPNGDFVLQSGDRLCIAAPPVELERFFKASGTYRRSARSVMILGGGRIAIYLARELAEMGIRVTIIERDRERCDLLCELVPKATVVCGDGVRQEVLREEGVATTDGFVALTGYDEDNIIISLYAASCGAGKVVTKVNEQHFIEMMGSSGLECFISPKQFVAQEIIRYVRAMQNSLGSSSVETLYRIVGDRVEALEFKVRAGSRCIGVPLRDLNVRSGILIIAVVRGGVCIIPDGGTQILEGDRAVVVTAKGGLNDLDAILEGPAV